MLLDQISGGMAALACLLSVIILRFVTLKWNFTTSSVEAAAQSEPHGREAEGLGSARPEPEAPQPSAAD